MSLIGDIRSHVLDHTYPLASILRQAMILAKKLGSEDLLVWVRSELEGYPKKDDLPDYRRCAAYSVGNGVSGNYFSGIIKYTSVPIPTHVLTDEMREFLDNGHLTGGIRELESLLESKKTFFGRPWPNELIHYFNSIDDVNIKLLSADVRMSRTAVENVLDCVRTRLLEFVIEIEELNPSAGSVPSLGTIAPTVTKQIFRKVIMNENYHGDVQKVEGVFGGNVATGQARISSSHASFTSTEDSTNAIMSLHQHLDEVEEANRAHIKEAIAVLVAASRDDSVTKSRIVSAAETIASASEGMKRALRDLSIGITGSLAATGVWEGIRYVIGHQ